MSLVKLPHALIHMFPARKCVRNSLIALPPFRNNTDSTPNPAHHLDFGLPPLHIQTYLQLLRRTAGTISTKSSEATKSSPALSYLREPRASEAPDGLPSTSSKLIAAGQRLSSLVSFSSVSTSELYQGTLISETNGCIDQSNTMA
ncbi:hypothetical protein BN1723_008370 [Verticillium longisporum]|uniref:Uncharacterized protein n=1 Tax=Verticillium longisporum TaxID=100787 RepID=A0A0G4NRF0_VERLO|nr:hypothetical protein BN1723_008370 [Verticillium longisporum]